MEDQIGFDIFIDLLAPVAPFRPRFKLVTIQGLAVRDNHQVPSWAYFSRRHHFGRRLKSK